MKHFYKNSLKIALISICVGVFMTLGGIIAGGIGLLEEVVKYGEVIAKIADSELVQNLLSDKQEETKEVDIEKYDNELPQYNYPIEECEIKNLDLDIGASDLVVKYEDTDAYSVFIEKGENYHCEVNNGTLEFETSEEVENILYTNYRSKITLVLPQNAKFEKIELNLGAGKVDAEYLEAEKISMKVGAGEAQIERMESKKDTKLTVGAGSMNVGSLKVEKDVEFKVEAGNMEFDSMQSGKTNISCEAGRFFADNASISSNVEVECGAGSVCLNMLQKEQDFNYDLECSVGSISLGKQEYSGLSLEQKLDNQAKQEFEIDCNVGSVEIKFEK